MYSYLGFHAILMNPYPMPKLIIEQGPNPGQEIVLNNDVQVVGREQGCDVVIADASVSRRHARLSRRGEQIVVEDLGSSNGTFINGLRLSAPAALTPGDTLGLGQVVRLKFSGPPLARRAT